MSWPVKKEEINRIRNEKEITQNRAANRKFNEIAKEAAREATSKQPLKNKLILQHDMSHIILTACILAHLNNIAEHGSFNEHLNHLLRKNNLPTFTADDDAPFQRIFNIAAMSRAVTFSQEELNSMMEEDDMLPPPPPAPEPSKPEKETKNKLSLPKLKDPILDQKNKFHTYLLKIWDWKSTPSKRNLSPATT